MKTRCFPSVCSLLFAALAGILLLQFSTLPAAAAQQASASSSGASEAPDLAAMQADIAHLKEMAPSQSHAMADVGFHWANLWFAAQKKNWPLADFYFNEARQHIRWTIRIRPVRKNNAGGNVDLKAIFDAMDSGPMTAVKQAIGGKDSAAFTAAYKQTLEACYGCHKASDKPFLRPMIPLTAPQPIINNDPDAKWPE